MSDNCATIHRLFNSKPLHSFPFDESLIPLNGIYILFQRGEKAHDINRIVRVGTHTGGNQLRSRLKQHFLMEKKDRSIFRKNIGRCILNKSQDTYLDVWELDFTTSEGKKKNAHLLRKDYQLEIERRVSDFIRRNFSFAVFPVEDKEERLYFEARIISTISRCDDCKPSADWLGLYSTKERIKESGLWQVNELYKEPLSSGDITRLQATLR
jgi:hypothetical protein